MDTKVLKMRVMKLQDDLQKIDKKIAEQKSILE
jgi:hypothetical protein